MARGKIQGLTLRRKSNRKKSRDGFQELMRRVGGRRVLKRRIAKGRKLLTVHDKMGGKRKAFKDKKIPRRKK